VERRGRFAVENYLEHAGAVAQINKNEAAEVAAAADPAHGYGAGAGVLRAEFAATAGAPQVRWLVIECHSPILSFLFAK
jgi:hypothetical protein